MKIDEIKNEIAELKKLLQSHSVVKEAEVAKPILEEQSPILLGITVLGVTLLVLSFLYQKLKAVLVDDVTEDRSDHSL